MSVTINGTSGVTTPGIANSEGYTGDGLTIAAGAPAGAMTLNASGNLLVGTTSGSNKLSINGTAATYNKGAYIIYSDAGSTYIGGIGNGGNIFGTGTDSDIGITTAGATSLRLGTNNTERMRIGALGLVTITSLISTYTTASSANMYVNPADGAISRSTSALKYKQDIRDVEHIDVNLFRPVRYKSKCENDDQTLDHFGIIADEVDAAGIKELVTYGENGEVEGFQYERLTVVLIKEIQELKARIEQLEAK